jgi:hypothetical protein
MEVLLSPHWQKVFLCSLLATTIVTPSLWNLPSKPSPIPDLPWLTTLIYTARQLKVYTV